MPSSSSGRSASGDRRIRQVVQTDYSDAMRESAIATSTGICAASRRSNCFVSSYAIAGEGDETQTGFGYSVGRSTGDLDVRQGGRRRHRPGDAPPRRQETLLVPPHRPPRPAGDRLAALDPGRHVVRGGSGKGPQPLRQPGGRGGRPPPTSPSSTTRPTPPPTGRRRLTPKASPAGGTASSTGESSSATSSTPMPPGWRGPSQPPRQCGAATARRRASGRGPSPSSRASSTRTRW